MSWPLVCAARQSSPEGEDCRAASAIESVLMTREMPMVLEVAARLCVRMNPLSASEATSGGSASNGKEARTLYLHVRENREAKTL
jgi:hypothetical protein